ncbi:single-strand selective monofunctional uracil DNA glycosylase isoform X1 [Alligator mississippiensis]|nr:single-strand selective monofunctional uracil DNA glycosylase isoform X1 [Alligator mississippiensis]XP_019338188.1 single-strand selective monofunctional uracil DNA glycosylase isoform X1 [Alligator mississippiensis]XP_059575414.1 single-strand selective monofunctional uracil DNA glycosylase isoform X1 [Alligator mississippiensis]XP_059575415.1 single-strand selective monofunctional uracil DNA glycosylase isoform X1 [Alligator mississippiensis]
MAGAIRRAANWKREEVRDLIALWGEESVQLALRKNHRNQAVYDAIALRMAARGHNRDGQQCRNKAKDLRRHYKQTRDANRRAGTKRATCPFYKELSRILAGNPGGRPRLLPGPGREPEDTDVSGSEEAPCEVAEDPSEGLVLFKTEEHEAVPLLHEGSSDETNLAEFQLPPLPPLPAAADSQPPPGQPAETPPTSDSDDPGPPPAVIGPSRLPPQTAAQRVTNMRRRRRRTKEEMLGELVASSERRARAAEEWRSRMEYHQDRCADLLRRGILQARRAASLQAQRIAEGTREVVAVARETVELLRENLRMERETQHTLLGLLARQTECMEAAVRPHPPAHSRASQPPS